MDKTTKALTESQEKVLEALRKWIDENGIPPTTRELAAVLDVSAASVYEQLGRLEKKGYISRSKNRARSLAVSSSRIINKNKRPDIRLVSVPVLGRIAAGDPLYAIENPDEEILVDASTLGTGKFFALKVAGDSMINADILNGSLVIIRRQPVAESGEIIAALLGEEATVKRLRIEHDKVLLIPENEKYQPIDVTLREDFRILGKVVSTVTVPVR